MTNSRARPEPNQARYRSLPVLIAIAVLLAGGWIAKTFLVDAATAKTILLMGLDEGETRADVVILARVDARQGIVTALSLPRDTLVEIPCEGLGSCLSPDKLAHAHVYGGSKGPAIMVQTVENLLGVQIDHYLRLNYAGFAKVVDALGGVRLMIEQDMDYEDPYANPPLTIHFKASPEPQHLNGEDALRYVRFRHDGLGDIGRVERTKKFAVALVEMARTSGSIGRLPSLVNALWPYVDTDMDAAAAVSLARLGPRLGTSHVQMETLPGADKVLADGRWVWVPDTNGTREAVDRLFRKPKPVAAEEK